jgi:glycosyltransferase involved in cell wall biosynthesis
MKKIKVLFGVYPWAFDCPGGGERQLLAYKEHLTNMGIQVDLYDQWNPRIKEYDIFHFFSVQPGSIHFCNYIKAQGLKLVISPNLWITPETKNNYPFQEIWNLFEIADKIIVNSDIEGNHMSNIFSMSREKFITIYNGMEENFIHTYDPGLFRNKYDQQRPYILNIANLEPRKNQLKFLEAMKSYPDLDFVVAGYIRDQEYAQKCIDLSQGQLKIVGPFEYNSDMLRSLITGCEFFAMPSLLETPSISALEAAASGTKILITEEGSTKEYFAHTVTYINPESVENMVTGISKSFQKESDTSRWLVQDRYMWEKCILPLKDCYDKLLRSEIL